MPSPKKPRVNRGSLSAFARDMMRGFEDFDPTNGWAQVANKDTPTKVRYGEFHMVQRLIEDFDLDMDEPTDEEAA